MPEEFEFRDLSEAVFWGVELRGATFRDVDLTGAHVSHARLVDVVIDGQIDGLVVNGVDVTAYVNERDPWFDLRSRVWPTTVEDVRSGWPVYRSAWEEAIARAVALPATDRTASVDGEWSFVETLRHLVFATDKWFTVPVAGGVFDPIGLPNSGSADFGWPGLDPSARPDFDAAARTWRQRADGLQGHLDGIITADLAAEVLVLENGSAEVHDCIGVVFEEHFQHLRYALRDLDRLDARRSP